LPPDKFTRVVYSDEVEQLIDLRHLAVGRRQGPRGIPPDAALDTPKFWRVMFHDPFKKNLVLWAKGVTPDARLLVHPSKRAAEVPMTASEPQVKRIDPPDDQTPTAVPVGSVSEAQPAVRSEDGPGRQAQTTADAETPQKRGPYHGAQSERAKKVLGRLLPKWIKAELVKDGEGYPDHDVLSTPDLWRQFQEEYTQVEGKNNKPPELNMPSRHTVLRLVGRLGVDKD
jgi:hypothetical protein